MLSSTLAIHWHDDSHPVYSLDFQPSHEQSRRLATGGGDKNVRIWRIQISDTGEPQKTSVEYLSTLRKHSQAVNAVRFNPSGNFLASAGDDGMLIIWSLAHNIIQEFGVQDDDMKESWVVHQSFNTNSEIYDICWSPDSSFVATGSMDNTTKIYNILTGQKVSEMSNHAHYVQGVSWDPLNEFLATQSADRSVNIHSLNVETVSSSPVLNISLHSKSIRAEIPITKFSDSLITRRQPTMQKHSEETGDNRSESQLLTRKNSIEADLTNKDQVCKKVTNLYHSENLQSFFRRLTFSPDGSLLLVPSGVCKFEDVKGSSSDGVAESVSFNTVYIYSRAGLNQAPICHIPGLPKPAIAVAFSPLKFQLSSENIVPVFALPYKMVFAVATHDAIIIYDTERLTPLGVSSNLHYLSITDLCWDNTGQSLMISSAEGFCSVITFEAEAFGPALENKFEEKKSNLTKSNVIKSNLTTTARPADKTTRTSPGSHFNKNKNDSSLNEAGTGVNSNVLKSSSNGGGVTIDSFRASEVTFDTSGTFEKSSKTQGGLNDIASVAKYQIQQFMANPVDAKSIAPEAPKRINSDASASERPQKKRITPTLINQ